MATQVLSASQTLLGTQESVAPGTLSVPSAGPVASDDEVDTLVNPHQGREAAVDATWVIDMHHVDTAVEASHSATHDWVSPKVSEPALAGSAEGSSTDLALVEDPGPTGGFDVLPPTDVRPAAPARRPALLAAAALSGIVLVLLVVVWGFAGDERDVGSTVGAQAAEQDAPPKQRAPRERQEGEDENLDAPEVADAPPARDVAAAESATDDESRPAPAGAPQAETAPAHATKASASSSSTLKSLQAKRRQLEGRMRTRSILSADDRKLASSLVAARRAERAGRTASMGRHLRAAEDRLAKIKIDQSFVERKLRRFNAKFENADPKKLEILDGVAGRLSSALAKMDYDEANRLLTAGLKRSR